MLRIVVPVSEGFDDETAEFVLVEEAVLELEHSLLSLSKWESKWEIPFLSSENKTDEQVIDYVRMMCLGEIPSEKTLSKLSAVNFMEIDRYINAKMTATTFREERKSGRQEIVTAEVIYYWMISMGIPFECQEWHLERLLTLIRVCNIKNAPKEKRNAAAVAAEQRALNAQRRRDLGSRG